MFGVSIVDMVAVIAIALCTGIFAWTMHKIGNQQTAKPNNPKKKEKKKDLEKQLEKVFG